MLIYRSYELFILAMPPEECKHGTGRRSSKVTLSAHCIVPPISSVFNLVFKRSLLEI